jgi:hybrid polyketide synthase/nonribosomal peptide synthetase FtdB
VGKTIDSKQLQKMLSSILPTYMMPSWFVIVEELPLSPNGKVDVLLLPEPEAKPIEMEAPSTFYEIKMAEHWRRLINVDQLSLHHDFFDVGGNSIKLIELIYNLQNEFNITIAVSQLFKITTLYGMAKTIENIIIGREEGQKPYLEFNAGRSLRLFCFPPAGGHGLIYRGLAEHMPEHSLVSFNYMKGDDKIERYADLMESLQKDGPYVLFGYSLGGNLAFEVAKVLQKRGQKVEKVVIMDSFRIVEHFEFGEEHLKEFEKELSEHLHRHTGSNIVAKETLEQARDYINFCSKVRNLGTLEAHVSVIAEEAKLALFAQGEHGSWHGSAKNIDVVRGFGNHAAMLDVAHVAANAELTLKLLQKNA